MTARENSPIDFSIVIPVYYNEEALESTLSAIREDVLAAQPGRRAEIVFVDDGSGDRSLEVLLRLRREDPALVKVIKLSRNFGQVSALTAGIAHARGRCVVVMSADGQDPPDLINRMLAEHFDENVEIVVFTREGRDESFYRIITSKIFYRMMRRLSFPNMPAGGFDFVLLGRRACDALLRNREAHPFFQGQILWLGFPIKFMKYRRRERKSGRSRWTFGKKFTYLLDGVMSYSYLPIRLISVLGVITALLGFLYAALIFVLRILVGLPVEGWAPLMITVLIMGGLQMLMLGLIGEYVWRTLAQSRNRDLYIIDTVYDDDE